MPTIGPAFEPLPDRPGERAEVEQLQSELQDQLDRGATHAFSTSFILAALLGLIALFPIGLSRRGGPVSAKASGGCWSIGAVVASLVLVGAYLAAGGSSYEPEKVQDPCKPRPWSNPQSLGQIANQFTISALDGAACQLGVTRETLARALATPEGRERFNEALRDRRREAGEGDPRRPAARGRRRRRSRRPEPVPRGPLRATVRRHPARPGDRTHQRRRIPARQRRKLPRPGRRTCSNNSCPSDGAARTGSEVANLVRAGGRAVAACRRSLR